MTDMSISCIVAYIPVPSIKRRLPPCPVILSHPWCMITNNINFPKHQSHHKCLTCLVQAMKICILPYDDGLTFFVYPKLQQILKLQCYSKNT